MFRIWVTKAESAIYVVTALVTAALTAAALQLWKADLAVPFNYSGDALPTGAHFKTVFEQGWYEYQPMLGAPAGQNYHDFPTADNLHMLAPYLFRPFTTDWALALNLYFLLGFILIAVAAVWFLRTCGVSRALTLALAPLYALAPYHFIRGESHLWLASYYAVPLALGLLVLMFKSRPLWGRGCSENRILAWLFSPTTRTILVVAILGSSSSYYSVFFILLLAFSGIITLIRDGNWRRFWGAVSVGLLTVAVMLINMLPDFVFSWINGANPSGLERSRGETEFLALKFVQLVLPWPGHRIEALSELRQRYDSAYLSLGEQPALGLVAAAGFLAAFVILVLFVTERQRDWAQTDAARMLGALSSLILIAFMFATLGGVSTIISIFTSSLRGWNRMSIIIAILSLAIVGLLLDLALRRLFSRPRMRRGVAAFLCLVLLGVGYFDQTPGDVGDSYESTRSQYLANDAWVASIEDRLPHGAMVLMLPYVPFPESQSATGTLASDQLIPYLHSTAIRWSNGGIKGRPTTDWPGQLANYPAESLPTLAAAAGFSGIVVDRAASADGGNSLEEALSTVLDQHAYPSPDTRFAYFDITSYANDVTAQWPADDIVAARDLILDPVTVYATPGFNWIYDEEKQPVMQAPRDDPHFTIANTADEARSVDASFTVTPSVSQGTVTVTWPDGSTSSESFDGGPVSFSREFTSKPGVHTVSVRADDLNGIATTGVELSSVSLVQRQLADFLAKHG